jgi:hypothetical protein
MSERSGARELDEGSLRRTYAADALGFASTREVKPSMAPLVTRRELAAAFEGETYSGRQREATEPIEREHRGRDGPVARGPANDAR